MLRTGLPRGFTTRFAPAPTGHLHIGHVVNAVWVWGLARAHGGRVLLRIEDHDRGRSRPEYEASIREDLAWLGFIPSDAPALRQSDNLARYAAQLASLEARGLAYPCTCSRAEIGESRYPGTCRTRGVSAEATSARRVVMTPGEETFEDLRLGPQRQDPDTQCGDVLARDRNGNFTYQFAVVVDDLDQGVDVVIRGEDLLDSTGRQLRLARLLGRTTPPQFVHHPLVRHPDGTKLSKSAGDTGVRELRARGQTPEQVIALAKELGGFAL